MSDYDLQFQAELERAQELSLETLALEQFRRQRSTSHDPAVKVDNEVILRGRWEGVESEPPPALPPPPRRASRSQRASFSDQPASAVPPVTDSESTPTRPEDLISFNAPANNAHSSLKEYIDQINKLGEQTQEMSINPNNNQPSTPSTPYYNHIQAPRYVYPPHYNYQYQYAGYPPHCTPTSQPPYGMQSPVPAYAYYSPHRPVQDPNQTNRQNSPYPMPVPYNHTRMASPGCVGYPPPRHAQPQYNFNTTNLISRPTRPTSSASPSLYPQLSQLPNYSPQKPATSVSSSYQSYNPASTVPANVTLQECNSSRPELMRNLSETSEASNESNDTVGSLPKSMNLIDFTGHNGANGQGNVRVSVLEAFDPLLTEQNNPEYVCASECSSSVYEEFDPLDFLYGEGEREGSTRDTLYVSNKRESIVALPSPPPKSIHVAPPVERVTTHKLYDCIVKTRARIFDIEYKGFHNMVLDVRKQFKYSDIKTNPGYVIAARSGGKYPPNTSIKLLVHHPRADEPITFTSDVESTVQHIILHVVCTLEEEIKEDMSEFMLRVWGANQYLTPGSSLSEYDYIRQCVRLEKDVRLCLTDIKDNSLARTEVDDTKNNHITLEDLMPHQGAPTLNFDNLSILLETLEGELSRAMGSAGVEGSGAAKPVKQAVKAICALAGGLETLHLTYSLDSFTQACGAQGCTGTVRPEIVSDNGDYSSVSLRSATPREAVAAQCSRVREAVRSLLELYMRTLHNRQFQLVDSHLSRRNCSDKAVPSHAVTENALFCIEAVHRLPPCWRHDEYLFQVQLYHGTRPLQSPHVTGWYKIQSTGFYPRIILDTWLSVENQTIAELPREARLVLTLYGRTQRATEAAEEPGKGDAADGGEGGKVEEVQEELGWSAIQLFGYDSMLVVGNYILPIWPTSADKRLGPAPHPTHAPIGQHAAVNIEMPPYTNTGVRWSEGAEEVDAGCRVQELPSFESLDGHTQQQLIHMIEKGAYQRMPPDCREILWEKRQYLVQIPGALPLVLLAATNWYGAHRQQLMSLVRQWEAPSALNAMHLLLPCFPDSGVREMATRIIGTMSDDTMSAVLPQLVQALRHETYLDSPLARFLLRRALMSPAIAHRLYWLLLHSAVRVQQGSTEEFLGISLEEGSRGGANEQDAHEDGAAVAWRWAHRYQLLLRALLTTCGESLANRLRQQQLLVKGLTAAAQAVKTAKDGGRQRALTSQVEQLCSLLRNNNIALPLALSSEVHSIDVKSCTYFNSNTLPLKINFLGTDNAVVPAMFKVGDDLRQDALVLQVMRVMDSLWLKEGLDLRMVTFQAIPTQHRKGMIEIVSEAETLRAIQTEWGLTGSFKDRPIAEWLAKHNPSELEYERARDNFTASCAGYSVATYLLGICDRHNDNIMLKTSGHLFHIDFGKFLGDAQMFANFRRDRAPFVLTSDMAYVINGGERPSQRFHYFVELCCMAFNIVRAHHNHILDLFALMATSGVPGVTMSAVTYVRGALLPGATQAEAAAAFARLIHSSLKSKFTPINFFLHNLAQLRASGDQNNASAELLSFMPRTYTMEQEGRILSVVVLGYEKRYDPEKHYVYSLCIYRQGQATPSVLYRSYKHFTELYQKICLHFPLAKVHSLPMGLHVGRTSTRQVAERRFNDVQAFVESLMSLADEIAHSDLVYTFFHPLLRDQQDAAQQRLKHKVTDNREAESSGSGSIKISVQYTANVLSVLILHAQSLAVTPQGLPPNPYVKVYLVPDPSKETKRKTRVLKRNSHPSFMEMLEYRMPIEVVRSRTLQATVWHYDSLQENQFLGGVLLPLHSLPLRQETVAWYPLEYIPR